jgi:branched-chain amino acid transport system permease protein
VSTVGIRSDVAGQAQPPAPVTPAAPVAPLWRRLAPWAMLGGGLAFGIVLQTQLYSGQVRLATTVLMFVSLASAWNLIGGYTGYACFGQVGFFGLGGYSTALLMYHLHWSFWLAMPLSAVIAGLFAVLVGRPLLRLKGHYFAVATLGVAEGLREVVINLPRLTGGGGGISIPAVGANAPTRWLGNDGFYVLFLVIAVVVVAVCIVVSTSRGGYALRAIHQDEDAAAAMGINTTVAKTAAFGVSAALTGGVGAAYAFQQQAIYPNPMFFVGVTVLMVVMVVIGGSGTVLGPIVGAVVIAFASEWLRQHYTTIHTFMLGGLIIVTVVLLPQGISTYLRDAVKTRRFSPLDNVRRYRL